MIEQLKKSTIFAGIGGGAGATTSAAHGIYLLQVDFAPFLLSIDWAASISYTLNIALGTTTGLVIKYIFDRLTRKKDTDGSK